MTITNSGNEDNLIVEIVSAAARATDEKRTDLTSLHSAVDTDALTSIITNPKTPVKIEFTWNDLLIHVDSETGVVVENG